MIAFAEIEARAIGRVGEEALRARLPSIKTPDELKAVPDDRYLSDLCRRIFRAGLKYSLVDGKWPAFEQVFGGFDPARTRAMPDEDLEALMGDPRIIRHWGKLKSVRANAEAMLRVADEHGSMGTYLARWPTSDVTGLWSDISKRFSQMGGNSAPYFLRMVGKDTFVLTDAVVKALNAHGIVEGAPKAKKDRAAVQSAFNAWAAETHRPYAHLSMILAASHD